MTESSRWQTLCNNVPADQVNLIVTTIAAMEFPVRVRQQLSGDIVKETHDLDQGMYIIETHEHHITDLQDALDQIIDEQQTFDREYENKKHRRDLINRLALFIVVVIIVVLTFLKVYIW